MIPALLPQDTKVAHKTGELLGVLHDAGVVYSPTGSYVLVMMSEKLEDPKKGIKAWAELSRDIFELHLAPKKG